jgi:hypothetical protein
MATVTMCDGCGKALDDKGQREFTVKGYDHNGKSLFAFGPLDICGTCSDQVKVNSDIKNWVRAPEHSA